MHTTFIAESTHLMTDLTVNEIIEPKYVRRPSDLLLSQRIKQCTESHRLCQITNIPSYFQAHERHPISSSTVRPPGRIVSFSSIRSTTGAVISLDPTVEMSSSNPLSSPANSIKKSINKPLVSSPPEVKKVYRPDGSSRPLTSSGRTMTSSAGKITTSAARPEGPKGKPTMGTPSASRPEKGKQPVQGVKREEPGSKGKEVVRSQVVKSPITISNSKPGNFVAKSEVKNKSPASTSKTDTKSTKTVKKTGTRAKTVKKVYTLPGQKHDPPEEREPLRIFYESLSKQIPTSEMAEFWMMEHGLLSPEKAKKAFEKKQKKQHQLRTGTPVKSVVKFERPESSRKTPSTNNGDTKAKKRVNYSDDDDDDFIVKTKRFKV